MRGDPKTFNPASYALSHLRFSLVRSVVTIATLTITVAFLLLTASLSFGLASEIEGGDGKEGLLEGRIPGSIDMFEEFRLNEELPAEVRNSLMHWLFFSTFLVLVVGFFIMYNTMAIAVEERKAEIGILRSVGFSSREVMKLFLAEGAFIGLIAWVTAIFIGTPFIVNLGAYLIERGDRGLFFVQPRIPIELVLISLFMTVGLCLLSTYLAASKAVRRSPIDVMGRHL